MTTVPPYFVNLEVENQRLRAEVGRLEQEVQEVITRATNEQIKLHGEIGQLRAEVERLTRLLDAFHDGAETAAEVERLQQRIRALEGMLGERVRAALENKP
jgi:gamma-glutamylcysteine synthetase